MKNDRKKEALQGKELRIRQNYGNEIISYIIKRISKLMAREFEGWAS